MFGWFPWQKNTLICGFSLQSFQTLWELQTPQELDSSRLALDSCLLAVSAVHSHTRAGMVRASPESPFQQHTQPWVQPIWTAAASTRRNLCKKCTKIKQLFSGGTTDFYYIPTVAVSAQGSWSWDCERDKTLVSRSIEQQMTGVILTTFGLCIWRAGLGSNRKG